MGPPAVPPPIKKKDSNTLTPVSGNIDEFEVGGALSTEGSEVTVFSVMIENDAGTELVGYKKTVTLTDETAGTEDVTIREYRLIAGVLTEF